MPQQKRASEQEKCILENEAAQIFIQQYNLQHRSKIEYLHHNAPSKPDVSCRLNGRNLDFEIAHLYGTEQEAMEVLGRELSEHTRHELQELEAQQNVDERLIQALNRIINNKALKSYDSNNAWLIIRNAHPIWRMSKNMKDDISKPATHPFEQIWLINSFDGQQGIERLFP